MAARFWFGGTGTWSDTAHWGTASNGVGAPASVPGSADTATFDANSGAGTCTVDIDFTVTSLTTSASATSIDFGTQSPTFSTAWTDAGSAAHTLTFGTGTFHFTGTSGFPIAFSGASTTVSAASATLSFEGTSTSYRTLTLGANTYGTISLGANTSLGGFEISGAATFTNFQISQPNYVAVAANITITNAPSWAGSSLTSMIFFGSNSSSVRTVTISNAGGTANYVALRNITFGTNAITSTNWLNFGNVTNAGSASPPSSGGGYVIGG